VTPGGLTVLTGFPSRTAEAALMEDRQPGYGMPMAMGPGYPPMMAAPVQMGPPPSQQSGGSSQTPQALGGLREYDMT
ncbi:unnamed protein product, partial [Symbiodinium pilosum]